MSEPGPPHPDMPLLDRLARRMARDGMQPLHRRSVLAGLATLGALAAGTLSWRMPGAGATSESALNDSVTAEGLLVTLLGVARTRATELALDEQTVRLLRAAQCQDEAHFNNLVSFGAAPTIGRYTIPPPLFENATNFLTTWVELKRIMISMYLTAAREFGKEQNFDLAELAFQIGTVEAQHFALLRQFLGERIPADRAFPEWQFASTAEAIAAIVELGFIDGGGESVDFPGPGDRYCRGITGLVAETTGDQTLPDVTPDPDAASPVSSEATPTDAGEPATPVANE